MLPEMGVGVTYTSELEPLISDNKALFQVLEIEPQTMWIQTRNAHNPFRVLDTVLESIAALPGKKIVHSIGAPVGGSVPPDKNQFKLLRQIISLLKSPYASEHLSFNAAHNFNTGFFLPPRQTISGVNAAVNSINILRDAIQVPLAVETGVNYLRRRSDEIPDGEFVARVVEKADCGILLDLHNLFANELNGRQSMVDFIKTIPLDRVWEVHLAGGFERDGYYLDAHSGEIDDILYKKAADIITMLPNLKTIIFEIFPSFLPVTGNELVKNEVQKLHKLWNLKGTKVEKKGISKNKDNSGSSVEREVKQYSSEWELSLGKLAIGHEGKHSKLYEELMEDPAVPVIQKLITEFRGSMLVAVLPLTCRLMILTLSEPVFMAILSDFWGKCAPLQFASSEALSFADYLKELNLKVPSLSKILEFESSVIETLADDKIRVVTFDFNPFPLLEALAERKLPERESELGIYEIEITPQVYKGLAEEGKYNTNTFQFH